MELVETPLDKLSNRALDAIEAGHFKQAERLCKKLLRAYPKTPDGHDRMGMLRMAQRRFDDAAHHYDKLLDMARKDPGHFHPEAVQYFTEQRHQAMAQDDSSTGHSASDDTESTAPHPSPAPAHRFLRLAAITAGIARHFRGR